MVRQGEMKAVFWGTGKEHTAQLFNLTSDPNEMTNLAASSPGLVRNHTHAHTHTRTHANTLLFAMATLLSGLIERGLEPFEWHTRYLGVW